LLTFNTTFNIFDMQPTPRPHYTVSCSSVRLSVSHVRALNWKTKSAEKQKWA